LEILFETKNVTGKFLTKHMAYVFLQVSHLIFLVLKKTSKLPIYVAVWRC